MTGIVKAPALGRTMTIAGAAPAVEARLIEAGFRTALPSALLVNADAFPDLAAITARCSAFAAAASPGTERLIVTILPRPGRGLDHWQAAATAAGLLAFTRRAALTWGPWRIRVNMIELAEPVPLRDIAEGVIAMTELPCLTGQQWTLGPAPITRASAA